MFIMLQLYILYLTPISTLSYTYIFFLTHEKIRIKWK